MTGSPFMKTPAFARCRIVEFCCFFVFLTRNSNSLSRDITIVLVDHLLPEEPAEPQLVPVPALWTSTLYVSARILHARTAAIHEWQQEPVAQHWSWQAEVLVEPDDELVVLVQATEPRHDDLALEAGERVRPED